MTAADITTSILLTGPTRGLGQALLDPLGRRRPESLILLGREPAALDRAAESARRAGANNVAAVQVDLADLTSVARAGLAVKKLVDGGHPPLTSVILNAGLQTADRLQRSAQGFELTFAVNVLAQHLLLDRLLPATAQGAHAVLVGSGTHNDEVRTFGLSQPPRWDDPQDLARPDGGGPSDPQAGARAYATSKLAVVYLAHEWQRRHPGRVRVNVYDPGLMPGTGLARDHAGWEQWLWNHVMPVLAVLPGATTPRRSADHLAAFALGERDAGLAGGYVAQGKVTRSSPSSYDPSREQRLWEVCEELVSLHAPRTA